MENMNPHTLETVSEAYTFGVTLGAAWHIEHYRNRNLAYTELREAYANWTRAETEHEHTSYYGRMNIRKSRAYFLGTLRGLRAAPLA